MVASDTEKNEERTTQVVEKRLKPTLIRRRTKTVKASSPEEEAKKSAEVAAESSSSQPPLESATSEEKPSTELTPPEDASSGQAATSPQEEKSSPRIGMVGQIELPSTTPSEGAKEAWRERQQLRAPRRRRSREELEMESIQRVGGLKQYATLSRSDEEETPTAAPPPTPTHERVFQPGATTGRRRKAVRRDFKKTELTERKASKKVIRIEKSVSVSDLSQSMGIKSSEIIRQLMDIGVMATVNQSIETDIASMIAQEFGFIVEDIGFKEEEILQVPKEKTASQNAKPRPPVVTVMGHVDHGKTSLLDSIRKTDVTSGEAGGITQHIGAHDVHHSKGVVTFLDTPGHEAFTSMRARGAQVTDIVILVVAADDGIMPQTIEAIDHAKAAGVPIIVAINKIDKPGAKVDRVKQALTEHELVPEDWGGDVICVETSAETGQGVDKLLEMILLQAEVLELKADPDIRPQGVVVEAKLETGRGVVATVLIREGTLLVGDFIVAGIHSGKVRAMQSADGKHLPSAGPSKPVEILGLSGVPESGDEVIGVASEKEAKLVAEKRSEERRKGLLAGSATVSLEDLQQRIAAGESEELVVVIKGDVHGSIEAVADSLVKLSTDKVKVKVLHKAVGGITESDVMLSSASKALIIGFNVKPDGKAKSAAEREKVEIRTYRIIYEILDDVQKAMTGLLTPEEYEVSLGTAEVRQVFKVSKVGQIAGCFVTQGKIVRNGRVRLLRDQAIVYEGKISSLKRFKEDAKEVNEGYECGIGIENYNDIKEGDLIEAYKIEEKEVSL